MFRSRLNRTVKKGQLVAVHYNSHQHTFSILDMKSRKTIKHVLGYADQITLIDCTTKIDKSKQLKVRETGVKDRHAYIVGYLENFEKEELGKTIHYDPAFYSNFLDKEELQENNTIKYINKVSRVNLCKFGSKPLVTYELG